MEHRDWRGTPHWSKFSIDSNVYLNFFEHLHCNRYIKIRERILVGMMLLGAITTAFVTTPNFLGLVPNHEIGHVSWLLRLTGVELLGMSTLGLVSPLAAPYRPNYVFFFTPNRLSYISACPPFSFQHTLPERPCIDFSVYTRWHSPRAK